VKIDVRSVNSHPEHLGLVSNWMPVSETVDQRPTTTAADVSPRYDILDDQSFWGPARNVPVTVTATDLDGANDLLVSSPIDPDIDYANTNRAPTPDQPYSPVSGEGGISVVTIQDPNSTAPDASAQVIIAYGASFDASRIVLVEGAIGTLDPIAELAGATATNSCTRGVGAITGQYWEIDCAATTIAGIGNVATTTLMVRPAANLTQGPFATPDQPYNVYGWTRDHRQRADNRYLAQDPATGVDSPWALAASTDLRLLVTDRIRPTITSTKPNEQDPNTPNLLTRNPDGSFLTEIVATDPVPSGASTPTTRINTGVAFVAMTVMARAANGADFGPQVAAAPQVCTPVPSRTHPPASPIDSTTCNLSLHPAGADLSQLDYNLHVTVADTAGNHITRVIPIRLAGIDTTPGACGSATIQAPLVWTHDPDGKQQNQQAYLTTPITSGFNPAPSAIWFASPNNIHCHGGTGPSQWQGTFHISAYDPGTDTQLSTLLDLDAEGPADRALVAAEMQSTFTYTRTTLDDTIRSITVKDVAVTINGVTGRAYAEIITERPATGTAQPAPGKLVSIRIWTAATPSDTSALNGPPNYTIGQSTGPATFDCYQCNQL